MTKELLNLVEQFQRLVIVFLKLPVDSLERVDAAQKCLILVRFLYVLAGAEHGECRQHKSDSSENSFHCSLIFKYLPEIGYKNHTKPSEFAGKCKQLIVVPLADGDIGDVVVGHHNDKNPSHNHYAIWQTALR